MAEPFTIHRAQAEFEAAGVVSRVSGDNLTVFVYDDEDDAELGWPITFFEIGYNA